MTIKHSPARTAHVVGAVASNHALPRQQLESIVADALQAALVYDADATYARADGIRTDGASSMATKPTVPTTEQQRRDSADRLKARRDAAADALKAQHKTRHGNGGSR